eukprot:41104-Eustigmatos_ZCMA.PRE.1
MTKSPAWKGTRRMLGGSAASCSMLCSMGPVSLGVQSTDTEPSAASSAYSAKLRGLFAVPPSAVNRTRMRKHSTARCV